MRRPPVARIYPYLILVPLVIALGFLLSYRDTNAPGRALPTPAVSYTESKLPSPVIFDNVEYIPAKCVALNAGYIQKIGTAASGISIFYDTRIPRKDIASAGILIKRSDGNFQCYSPK